jgi:hypothetical protein
MSNLPVVVYKPAHCSGCKMHFYSQNSAADYFRGGYAVAATDTQTAPRGAVHRNWVDQVRALFERRVLGNDVIVYADAHRVEGMPGIEL